MAQFNATAIVTLATGNKANPRFSANGNHNNLAHWAAIQAAFTAAKGKPVTMGALVTAQQKAHPTNIGNARPFLMYAINSIKCLQTAS